MIELLVVVAIIGILASVVLASLNSARSKGADAVVKANLANARSQAEIVYEFNVSSYSGVCTNGNVGAIGQKGIGAQVLSAAKATGLGSYATNPTTPGGTLTTATCNDSVGAWAAEAPLKTAGQMWCVDNTGRSRQTAASIGLTYVCP